MERDGLFKRGWVSCVGGEPTGTARTGGTTHRRPVSASTWLWAARAMDGGGGPVAALHFNCARGVGRRPRFRSRCCCTGALSRR
jgi:hypothetical protein